ncbi:MAG: hypothetical protein QOI62_1480 [Solirubrobacteraceae bacterium]|jgi:hypothetical protein|nr:hypothetical protein [Solirubrobacteraceae bacterium]
MRSQVDLDAVAERFDALYTAMTVLQRELIAAARGGVGDDRAHELAARVDVFAAAYRAAEGALAVGQPGVRDAEAVALRARVLHGTIDEHLLLAALKAQGRGHAFALLADALAQAAGNHGLAEAVGERTVAELLAAPRGMGARTAHRFAEHLALDPSGVVADLDPTALRGLCEALRDATTGLPDGVEDWRRRGAKPPADGIGARDAVLDVWIDAIGAPTDSARAAAVDARGRKGWPPDAVPTAETLVAFTVGRIAPVVIADWERIAAITDETQWLQAMRAERVALRHTDDEDKLIRGWALGQLHAAVTAARRARQLADRPAGQRGSSTPLAQARTAARRCGELVALADERATVEDLLADMPTQVP